MKISLFDDMSQCTEAEVKRLLPLVSEQRREQALRFKHLFGQFACLKSYVMLKQCVSDVMADDVENELFKSDLMGWNGLFVYNEHGKPFMQDINTGMEIKGVDFSISHCQKGIVVVLASQAVGIDIECYRHAEDSLLKKTMNDLEIMGIKASNNPAREFAFYWTAKEALLKLKGTGIVDELPQVLSGLYQAPYTIKVHDGVDKGYVYTVISSRM